MADSAVSVIVCTRDRPAGVARALTSIAAQTYRDFELIVVDDGSEPPAKAPTATHIIKLAGAGPGAARKAGLDAARGRFTAFCDDDDEWTPDHLEALVAHLERNPDVGLVYSDSAWVGADGGESVPYSIDHDSLVLREDNCIFPTDVLLRTELARAAGGFDPSLRACEDWDLWVRMSTSTLLRHVPKVLARRRDCPDGVLLADDRWQSWMRVFERNVERFAALSRADEHDLLVDDAERRGFDPSTWSPPRRELVWHSILRPNHSFGSTARRLLPALERNGVSVTIAPCRTQASGELARFHRPLDHWGRFAFYYDYRQHPGVLPSSRIVNYAMWESDAVPEWIVDEINRVVELQYTPSDWMRRNFVAAGVEVPVRVLHHGVSVEEFPYVERPARAPFTFGTFGDLSHRKGADVLVRAFEQEFDPGEPVRLVLGSNRAADAIETHDPRVELRTGFLSQSELHATLVEMDAFVLPSRGEGFGLVGLEAMATGLPLIATDWSGPADYLDDDDSLRLAYELVDADGVYANQTRYFGRWAEPDLGHLRQLMRRLATDADAAREMGARAADRVRREWTWDRPARQIRDDLDALA